MPDGSSSDAPVISPGPRMCRYPLGPCLSASSTPLRPAVGPPVAAPSPAGLATRSGSGSAWRLVTLAAAARRGSGASSSAGGAGVGVAISRYDTATVGKHDYADLMGRD